MTNEHIRSYKVSVVISLIAGFISIFYDIRIANGLFIGLLASFMYLVMMSYTVGGIIDSGNSSKWSLALTFIMNIMLLGVVFLIVFMFMDIFSYWGLFAGLIIEKIIYVIMNFRG